MSAADCSRNDCGHVDSEQRDPYAHGGMTPHDMEALLDALQHALGLSTRERCYVCHLTVEWMDSQLSETVTGRAGYIDGHAVYVNENGDGYAVVIDKGEPFPADTYAEAMLMLAMIGEPS